LSGEPEPGAATQRIDKWLWVARFFRTRSAAAAAVAGGKVQVEAARVKPARRIGPGALLSIRRGAFEWQVTVRGLSSNRLPAREAVALYEETPASAARRTAEAARRRETEARRARGLGRPTKRERRIETRIRGLAAEE
jgi:ribosome-associated heat shock protein Hsp15